MRALTKAQRLNELQRLLVNAYKRDGISIASLVEKLGVDRTTIQRNIQELDADGYPIIDMGYGLYALAPEHLLHNLQFTSTESLVIYLAARRVARQASYAHVPVVNALEKLSGTLRKSFIETLLSTAEHAAERPGNPEKDAIFDMLIRSYNEQITVQIGYRGLHSTQTRAVMLSPYLFEPSPWGEGIYIIGYSETFGGLGTFKLERIERITLTTQQYDIPADIDPDELLRHTWGIWMHGGEPVEVVLHFSPYVARRLRENRWHPSEHLRDLANGWVEWIAQVDEPQEMLPWIRGWGADVEVIAPEPLRNELVAEVQRLMRRYGIHAKSSGEYDLDEQGEN